MGSPSARSVLCPSGMLRRERRRKNWRASGQLRTASHVGEDQAGGRMCAPIGHASTQRSLERRSVGPCEPRQTQMISLGFSRCGHCSLTRVRTLRRSAVRELLDGVCRALCELGRARRALRAARPPVHRRAAAPLRLLVVGRLRVELGPVRLPELPPERRLSLRVARRAQR